MRVRVELAREYLRTGAELRETRMGSFVPGIICKKMVKKFRNRSSFFPHKINGPRAPPKRGGISKGLCFALTHKGIRAQRPPPPAGPSHKSGSTTRPGGYKWEGVTPFDCVEGSGGSVDVVYFLSSAFHGCPRFEFRLACLRCSRVWKTWGDA